MTTFTVFGDSISAGFVNENGQIHKIDESVVNILSNELGTQIENKSAYGQTLSRMINKNIISNYLDSINKKDKNIAVISIGGNDSDYDWKEVEKSPLAAHNQKTPLVEFTKLMKDTITLLQKNNVSVVVTTIPPVNSKRYFENVISKLANPSKVLQFLENDITNIERRQEAYNIAIVKCATSQHCDLLDIRTPLLNSKDYLSLMCDDGVHPNAKGHKLMAKTIMAKIDDIKKQR